jgi:hypothetical protein
LYVRQLKTLHAYYHIITTGLSDHF